MDQIQNDLSQKYSKGTIIIHWTSALLILLLFPLGKYIADLPAEEKLGPLTAHIIMGDLVLLMTIYRSWLFFKAPRPPALQTGAKWNDKLAVWVHNSFYFLIFLIAASGMATIFAGGYGDAYSTGDTSLIKPHGEIPPLGGHNLMATIMMILLLAHVIGVIKHYVVMKENTLRRIF